MSVREELDFINGLQLTEREHMIADGILKEIRERLGFLQNVGLDYLTLARNAATLSGGESQRIRLATQIGSALTGVLYVLDEPSIGLHQRDNSKLIATLKRLRDLGNTLIVVEHDEETMREADWIDLLAVRRIRAGKLRGRGHLADIRLFKLADRQAQAGQNILGQPIQHVTLVALRADGGAYIVKAVLLRYAGVMPCCDIADAQTVGHTGQRCKLIILFHLFQARRGPYKGGYFYEARSFP